MTCLNVIYDLSVEPLHFGILPSLVCSEIVREERGYDESRLIIVMGPGGKYRNLSARDKSFQEGEQSWRLYNMIIGASRLLPTCKSVAVFDDRELFRDTASAFVPFIPDSDLTKPRRPLLGKHKNTIKLAKLGKNIQRLQAPDFAVSATRRWLDTKAPSRPKISLTLRQSSMSSGRNSKLEQWIAFADYLEKLDYVPIFVPDTEVAMNGNTGIPSRFIVNEMAALNMEVRCALYEACDLNYFVGNGPTFLAYFNKNINYIICNLLVPGYPTEEPEHYEKLGMPVGTQMVGQENEYGRIVWEPGEADVLCRTFEEWRSALT